MNKNNKNQLPREKMLFGSVKDLSDTELLEVILGSGIEDNSVDKIASEVIDRIHGNLFELEGKRPEEFYKTSQNGEKGITGINEAKACLLVAAVELGLRVIRRNKEDRVNINNPDDVKAIFMADMRGLKHEEVRAVMLNSKMQIVGKENISSGGLHSACIDPSKVFIEAIKRGSLGMIIAHNHPSGDCTPSKEDILSTKQLISAGKIIGIQILDHVIIGDNEAFSFRENDLI